MQTRLGSRLTYSVDIPQGIETLGVPPGMIITLVENALKHGIEPAPAGGAVRVVAALEGAGAGERVVVTVADTGAGLAASPGHGIGLANIRERLQLLYGNRASLTLGENEPRGFVASIALPRGDSAATDERRPSGSRAQHV